MSMFSGHEQAKGVLATRVVDERLDRDERAARRQGTGERLVTDQLFGSAASRYDRSPG
jgi:hypothetical protein